MKKFVQQFRTNWRRRLVCSGITGTIIGICLVFGYCVEKWMAVPYTDIRLYMVLFLCIIIVNVLMYLLFTCLDNRSNKDNLRRTEVVAKKYHVFIYAGIIFAGWIPALLGVYPGWFNYDAPWQWAMFVDQKITAHHPVLHTVILGSILEFMKGIYGTYNKGIALYLMLQMVVMAVCLGYVVYYMRKKKVGRVGRIITLLWFILFPAIVLHATSATKDTLFAGFFVTWLLLTYDLLVQPEGFFKKWFKPVGWVLLLFLCIVFRQNSLYVFLLMAVPFVIILRKHWKKTLGMIVATGVLYGLYLGPFYNFYNVEPGSRAEFLSVPSQQLVRVYLQEQDTLTATEKMTLEALFKEEAFEKFRPKLADFTKGNLRLEVMDEMGGEFWKTYLSLFLKYPDVYLDAFWTNTYGFWYPDATVDIYEDGVSYYYPTSHIPPAVSNSKIPILLKYYSSFYTDFPVEDGGPITWVLTMALYFYLLLITFMYAVYRKNRAGIVCSVTVLLLWMTYLLGPVAMVRYVLFLYILPPVEYLWVNACKEVEEK